ncbi:hypothetical protein AGLY_013936, partial [Aphis glycines]
MPYVVCHKKVFKTITCYVCSLSIHPTCTSLSTCEPNTVDLNNIQSSIHSVLNKLKKLDLLIKSFNEVQESLSFYSNKIDDFSIKLDNVMSKVNDNSKLISVIDNKIFKMQEEIDFLKMSHYRNEQINDVPVTTNESLIDILFKLANLVKINLVKVEVNNIYRIKRANISNNNISNIIIIFNNMNKKIELVKAFKTQFKTKPIVASDLFSNFTSNSIYMNDQLSTYNKKILWVAKQVAKNYYFKFVWTNINGVFMKIKEGNTGIRVSYNSLYMAISKGNLSYYLTAIYRSPSINSEEFLSSFGLYLSDLSPNSNHILCGDINIDLLTMNGFYSACNIPTRITKIFLNLNILNRLIKESKNLFYGKKIIKAGNNSKLIWDCIKEASNTKINKKSVINEIFDKHGNIVTDIKEIANIFNSFFVN